MLRVVALCTPGVAAAERGSALVQLAPGMANREANGVGVGPYLRLEGALGISDQLYVVATASGSRHRIDSLRGGGNLDVGQLGGGFSLLLDEGPLLPLIDAGLTAAYRTTPRSSALDPWPYLGLTLAIPRAPWLLGVSARYGIQLRDGQGQFGYLQLALGVGIGRKVTRP